LGSAWFSQEEDVKGRIVVGQRADFAILDRDYFTVPEGEVRSIESVLTVIDGKSVYGTSEFAPTSPEVPAVSPAWSPVAEFGGYFRHR
jgi:hypothetical protein